MRPCPRHLGQGHQTSGETPPKFIWSRKSLTSQDHTHVTCVQEALTLLTLTSVGSPHTLPCSESLLWLPL